MQVKESHMYVDTIIFQIGLTPYEILTYIHLKKICGNSNYIERSMESLAEEIGMSLTKFRECTKKLCTPKINGIPLISIQRIKTDDGGNSFNRIYIEKLRE